MGLLEIETGIPMPIKVKSNPWNLHELKEVGMSRFYPSKTVRQATNQFANFRNTRPAFRLWSFVVEETTKMMEWEGKRQEVAGVRVWRDEDREPVSRKKAHQGNKTEEEVDDVPAPERPSNDGSNLRDAMRKHLNTEK